MSADFTNHRVYDSCQYIHCHRGKHKGDRLFRFPRDPKLRKKWIKSSGNNLLRNWAPSSIRSAGLCALHFKEEDFTTIEKTRLKRKILPMKWQDIVHDQKCTDQQNAVPTMQKTVHNTEPLDEHEQIEIDSVADENFRLEVTTRVTDVIYPSVKKLNHRSENVQTHEAYFFGESFPRIDNNNCIDIIDKPICSSKKTSMDVRSIVSEITSLEKTLKMLKKDLKNEKKKNARLCKWLDKESKNKIRTIDDLLNNHTLTSSSGTQIKSQFHTNKNHCSNDKRDFCKVMYDYSLCDCSSR